MVNAYLDGSLLIHHGGIEMGQGIHTKMIQVASRVLEIPVEKIHVAENSAHIVPHTSDTAASYGTDIYGMAVKVIHWYLGIPKSFNKVIDHSKDTCFIALIK